jgi:aspartate racemase
MTDSLGILGGMGPLASAEFLKTIYEFNISSSEQDSPACVLYSDPSVPDRTEAILNGSDDLMLERLTEALEKLHQLNAAKIVVTCVTSHHLLPRIAPHLTENIVSLVDLIMKEVLSRQTRSLLLCSEGTRRKRLFQQHCQWIEAEQYVVLPNDEDQAAIHSLIYRLKQNGSAKDAMHCLSGILQKYELDSFIAGCTEVHLLTKYLMSGESRSREYGVIDPLMTLAKNLKSLTNA